MSSYHIIVDGEDAGWPKEPWHRRFTARIGGRMADESRFSVVTTLPDCERYRAVAMSAPELLAPLVRGVRDLCDDDNPRLYVTYCSPDGVQVIDRATWPEFTAWVALHEPARPTGPRLPPGCKCGDPNHV